MAASISYQILEWQKHDIDKVTREECSYNLLGLIEQGDFEGVRAFYRTFPHLKNKITGLNQWTPAMYAARYGTLDILRYLHEEGFRLESKACPHGIVMSACFGNCLETLKYLLEVCGLSANPETSDTSPLRYCLKNGLLRLSNLLISRGAYFYISPKLCQGVRKEDEKIEKYTCN